MKVYLAPKKVKTIIMTNNSIAPSTAAKQMAEKCLYSEIPEINQRIIDILPKLHTAGFLLEDARPIPYGSRILLRTHDSTVGFTFYFSKKKGHSTVFDKKTSTALVHTLRPLLEPGPAENIISPFKREQQFDSWIGCDEGGKGAFTGPLVAVAFFADRKIVQDLFKMGVVDSKTLGGKKLRDLSSRLERRYAKRISVLELKPETYNRLYADFRSQNRSLNHLLAWAHGKAIEKLMPDNPDAIVVDQFARIDVIRPRIPSGPELVLRTKAENNIGVAAASIVAGGRYLDRLASISREIGVELAPGAGTAADQSVVCAVKKHGRDIMEKIVKLHFRNTEKVLGKLSI